MARHRHAAAAATTAVARTLIPQAVLDRFQMLTPASRARLSISSSSAGVKAGIGERADGVLDLLDARGADQRRGHARSRSTQASAIWASVWPRFLATSLRPRTQARFSSLRKLSRHENATALGAAVVGHALEVAVGEQALGERRERDAAHPLLLERVEQLVLFRPAVEDRVARLVDERRRAEVAQDFRRLMGALRRIGRDADVERLAGAHRRVERAHGFLERRVGIEAVRIEDVDVVEPHALEALVEAREQVLAAPPLAVGAGPHVVAGLGRDDQLVAVGAEVAAPARRRRIPPPNPAAGRSCWRGRSG